MTGKTILIPDVDSSGEVVELCVPLGDSMTAGDSLLVVASDKAAVELPTPKVILWESCTQLPLCQSCDHR
ncbi:MAG: biotin/lipoyl-containing protein [Motiliproteus sp.]